MSARFAFATGLVFGDITFDSLRDFTDPQVLDLISRIDLVAEPGASIDAERQQVSDRVLIFGPIQVAQCFGAAPVSVLR